MEEIEIGIIIGIGIQIINEIIIEIIRNKWRKECNYKCEKCKVFDCNYWKCKKRKNNDKKFIRNVI